MILASSGSWQDGAQVAMQVIGQSSVGTGIPGVATGEKHFRLPRIVFKTLEVRDGSRYGLGGDRRFRLLFALTPFYCGASQARRTSSVSASDANSQAVGRKPIVSRLLRSTH